MQQKVSWNNQFYKIESSSEQLAWNVKAYLFLKNKDNYFKMASANTLTHAKR